jgi:hypothetical protein
VFELSQTGTETVLHLFVDNPDGNLPSAGLIADNKGNLYGTTQLGGASTACAECGTVFQVTGTGFASKP